MKKPVLGLLLGGALGVVDGLTALISAPETAPMITDIVIGSTIKGVIVGVLVGWFATKRVSIPAGVIVGLAIGAFFAFLVAVMPNPDGTHYYWQIMLPGSVLGMIVGYATQRYGTGPSRRSGARPARVG
jgi:peptidoglycan/LPS O-acetylase OafA/YrhL